MKTAISSTCHVQRHVRFTGINNRFSHFAASILLGYVTGKFAHSIQMNFLIGWQLTWRFRFCDLIYLSINFMWLYLGGRSKTWLNSEKYYWSRVIWQWNCKLCKRSFQNSGNVRASLHNLKNSNIGEFKSFARFDRRYNGKKPFQISSLLWK